MENYHGKKSENCVSVVIPVYNVEKYLDRCVESVISQTYRHLEIILVDDGSPDNCPSMCDIWAQKDARIRVIHQENGGLAHARNSGIKVLTGDYVLFVDSDDYIEADMIEFLLTLAVDNQAAVARCGFYQETKDSLQAFSSNEHAVKLPDKNEMIKDLAVGGHISGVVWNKLYKSEIVKNHLFDKADGCSEDILYNYRIYQDGVKAVFCDIPKYHYVIHPNSITNAVFNMGAFDIVRAKNIMLAGEKENAVVYPYVVKGYIQSAYIVLSSCIHHRAYFKQQKKLRREILQYKKAIFFSGLYSLSYRLRTWVLWWFPHIYQFFISRKGAHR